MAFIKLAIPNNKLQSKLRISAVFLQSLKKKCLAVLPVLDVPEPCRTSLTRIFSCSCNANLISCWKFKEMIQIKIMFLLQPSLLVTEILTFRLSSRTGSSFGTVSLRRGNFSARLKSMVIVFIMTCRGRAPCVIASGLLGVKSIVLSRYCDWRYPQITQRFVALLPYRLFTPFPSSAVSHQFARTNIPVQEENYSTKCFTSNTLTDSKII